MGQPLAATTTENTMSGRLQPASSPWAPGGNAACQRELDAQYALLGLPVVFGHSQNLEQGLQELE